MEITPDLTQTKSAKGGLWKETPFAESKEISLAIPARRTVGDYLDSKAIQPAAIIAKRDGAPLFASRNTLNGQIITARSAQDLTLHTRPPVCNINRCKKWCAAWAKATWPRMQMQTEARSFRPCGRANFLLYLPRRGTRQTENIRRYVYVGLDMRVLPTAYTRGMSHLTALCWRLFFCLLRQLVVPA
jgi:hypothetical protein